MGPAGQPKAWPYCLGHPVHSAICCQVWQRLALGFGKGSGRSWVQAEKLQGKEREDSGVTVLQLEAKVNTLS